MNFFAYGPLRPGGNRHSEIADMVHGQCEGYFEGRLFVRDDGLPILVEAEPAYPVLGAMLDLPDSPVVLERLDAVIGTRDPRSVYLRVQRRIGCDRGDEMAWVYLCKDTEVATVAAGSEEILEGDWFLHSPPAH